MQKYEKKGKGDQECVLFFGFFSESKYEGEKTCENIWKERNKNLYLQLNYDTLSNL